MSDMHRIHRHNYENKFTVLPNQIVEHEFMSWGAKSLLWYLLSRPADWIVHRCHLSKIYKGDKRGNGSDSIDGFFKELIELRYIIYTQKDDITGKFIHRYDVYPVEQPENQEIKKKIPEPVKPVAVLTPTGLNSPLQRNDSLPRNENNKNVVVVFPCINKLNISQMYKEELSKDLDEPKAEILVKRVLKWSNRTCDGTACRTILARWDSWGDGDTLKDREEQIEVQANIIKCEAQKRKERALKLKEQYPEANFEIGINKFDPDTDSIYQKYKNNNNTTLPRTLFSSVEMDRVLDNLERILQREQ